MSRCWGITKNFHRCAINAGEKRLCHKHAKQPRKVVFLVIISIFLGYIATLIPNPFRDKYDIPPVHLLQMPETSKQTPKIENQSQKRHSMDTIPDVSKAKREVLIKSKEQLKSTSNLTDVSTHVPGYFVLTASPTASRYSYARVDTIEVIKPHFYASARIIGLQGSLVLDFGGRDVYFGLKTTANEYYIYESEEHWTTWRKLNTERADQIDTLSIYQIGRNVSVFLNGVCLSTFTKLKKAEPGSISISFKANFKTGGQIHFQKLSIWEF